MALIVGFDSHINNEVNNPQEIQTFVYQKAQQEVKQTQFIIAAIMQVMLDRETKCKIYFCLHRFLSSRFYAFKKIEQFNFQKCVEMIKSLEYQNWGKGHVQPGEKMTKQTYFGL